MSHYTIPFPVGTLQFSVMLVLSDESIARIRERDPAELTMRDIIQAGGPLLHGRTLKDVVVTYATAEEIETVVKMLAEGRGTEALRLLTRGYRFKPGDDDAMSKL